MQRWVSCCSGWEEQSIQREVKSFKVTGSWEEAGLGLAALDSGRCEASGELPVARDTGT